MNNNVLWTTRDTTKKATVKQIIILYITRIVLDARKLPQKKNVHSVSRAPACSVNSIRLLYHLLSPVSASASWREKVAPRGQKKGARLRDTSARSDPHRFVTRFCRMLGEGVWGGGERVCMWRSGVDKTRGERQVACWQERRSDIKKNQTPRSHSEGFS